MRKMLVGIAQSVRSRWMRTSSRNKAIPCNWMTPMQTTACYKRKSNACQSLSISLELNCSHCRASNQFKWVTMRVMSVTLIRSMLGEIMVPKHSVLATLSSARHPLFRLQIHSSNPIITMPWPMLTSCKRASLQAYASLKTIITICP